MELAIYDKQISEFTEYNVSDNLREGKYEI